MQFKIHWLIVQNQCVTFVLSSQLFKLRLVLLDEYRYVEAFKTEALLPKMSSLYGMVVEDFMVSPIRGIGNRFWQLRSVFNRKRKEWILLPFVLDSGAGSNAPIFSNGSTRLMFDCDMVAIKECRDCLQFPLPLQDFPQPFMRDWDTATDSKVDSDMRANLIGYEVVLGVSMVHHFLADFNDHDIHRALEKME
jgi:hypothetical protein